MPLYLVEIDRIYICDILSLSRPRSRVLKHTITLVMDTTNLCIKEEVKEESMGLSGDPATDYKFQDTNLTTAPLSDSLSGSASGLSHGIVAYIKVEDTQDLGGTELESLQSVEVKDQTQKKYQVCQKEFTQTSHLNRDMSSHTGEKPHQCQICQKQFKYVNSIDSHMLTHPGEIKHTITLATDKTTNLGIKEEVKEEGTVLSGDPATDYKIQNTNLTTAPLSDSLSESTRGILHGEVAYIKVDDEQDLGGTELDSLQSVKVKDHTQKKYQVCENQFPQTPRLKRDMSSHTGEKPHQCQICLPHQCQICQKQFTRAHLLKRHVSTHTGEKSHRCEVCQKQFAQRGSLKRHMSTHTGEKPHRCEVCQKQFAQRGSLKRHMSTHTGEKPHRCQICQKHFTRQHLLRSHIFRHTGDLPYQCEVCQKKFTDNGTVKRHMLTHTGEKPHQCKVCHKQYRYTNNLKSHMLTHTGEKPARV